MESGEVYKAHEEMHTLRQKLTCVDNERAALLQRIDEERREKEALMLELEQLRVRLMTHVRFKEGLCSC